MARPLVIFDIETTGIDKKKDYIIQFSALKYDVETGETLGTINHYIQPSGNYTMSVVGLTKHRITPKFLMDKPIFADVAVEIYEFLDGCDLLTYNGLNFDAPFLKREFADCGITWTFSNTNFYDAYKEELRRNNNQLSSTFERYTGKTMEDCGYTAHDAMSDVKATLDIFLAQQKIKEYAPEDILTEDGVIKVMDFAGKDKECFTVGKWKDVSLEYVALHDKSYLRWVVSCADFDNATKAICEKYLA